MKQKILEWAGPYGPWCLICSPETEETHVILPFGLVTLPSEPAMNAAGRTSDHPFKDLRSARHAHQRSKRYPERIYSGNKRRRSDKPRPLRVAASKHAYKGIESQEWEGDWHADTAHTVDMESMDNRAAYYLFDENADILQCYNDGDISAGEDLDPGQDDASQKSDDSWDIVYTDTVNLQDPHHYSSYRIQPATIHVPAGPAPPSSQRPMQTPTKQPYPRAFPTIGCTSH